MAKRGIWLASIERFGYVLTAAGRTEQEAFNAVMDEYRRSFLMRNGISADSPAGDYGEAERTYAEIAMDEIYCRKLEYGKVVWE